MKGKPAIWGVVIILAIFTATAWGGTPVPVAMPPTDEFDEVL